MVSDPPTSLPIMHADRGTQASGRQAQARAGAPLKKIDTGRRDRGPPRSRPAHVQRRTSPKPSA